jgi:fatty acid-binding protein DegV
VSVAIVTDSTAYLPADLVRAGSVPITVVPLHVVVGGKQHREGVDVTISPFRRRCSPSRR